MNNTFNAVQWLIRNVARNDMSHCIDIVLQPFVNIQKRKCTGAEVLVRGYYEQRVIYPDSFIPALENNGTILYLDLFVLAQGLVYARSQNLFRQRDFALSFNFSPLEFNHPDFVPLVCEAVTRDEAQNIILEITETDIVLDTTGLRNILQLQCYGFTVAWDDIHCMNLAQKKLDLFPCRLVKLDRSTLFPANLECANTLINFYQQQQLAIIVEGVENEQQLQWLLKKDISLVQGYYFSRPINKQAFAAQFLDACL